MQLQKTILLEDGTLGELIEALEASLDFSELMMTVIFLQLILMITFQ